MGNWSKCEGPAEAPSDPGAMRLRVEAWKLRISGKGTEDFCKSLKGYRDYGHNGYLKIQTLRNLRKVE